MKSPFLASHGLFTKRIREIIWISSGQFFAALGAIAAIKILTNVLSPGGYGKLALGISLAGMINMLVFGPLGQIVLRFYSTCMERGQLGSYIGILERLHINLSFGVILFGGLLCVPISILYGQVWGLMVFLAVLFGISSGIQGSLLSVLNASQNRKSAALSQALDPWLRLIMAAAILYIYDGEDRSVLAGFILGSIAVVIVQMYFVRSEKTFLKENREPEQSDLTRDFGRYGYPFVGFALLAIVSQYADRWILQSGLGDGTVGVYAAMLQIATAPIAIVVAVVTQFIIPIVFARVGPAISRSRIDSGQALLKLTVIAVALVSVALTWLAYVWAPEIVNLLTNKEYTKHSDILWILVLAVALFNIGQILVATGLSINRSNAYLFPKFAQALAVLILGLVWVQSAGISGMAYALLTSSAIYLCLVVVVNRRLIRAV